MHASGLVEWWLRRGFVAIELAAVLAAALVVARGVNALIEAALVVPPRPRRAPPASRPPSPEPTPWPEDVVTSRNLFDSSPAPVPDLRAAALPPAGPVRPCGTPALRAPFALAGVAGASVPAHALASFRVDGKLEFARLGDEIGGYRLTRIRDHRVCLEGAAGRLWADVYDPPDRPPAKGKKPARKIRGAANPPSHVRKLGPNRWAVDSAWLSTLAAKRGGNLARAVPRLAEGGMDGLVLRGLRPNEGLYQLGLREGDVLTSVNGLAMDSVRAGAAAPALFGSEAKLELEVERGRRSLRLRYEVR